MTSTVEGGGVRLTGPGRELLERIAAATEGPVFVLCVPGSFAGTGVQSSTYDRLERDGLVELGGYVPKRGRPLLLTQAGRAVLNAPSPPPRPAPRALRVTTGPAR